MLPVSFFIHFKNYKKWLKSLLSFFTIFFAFYLLHEFTTDRQIMGAKQAINERMLKAKTEVKQKVEVGLE